jgi:hypothetical protein
MKEKKEHSPRFKMGRIKGLDYKSGKAAYLKSLKNKYGKKSGMNVHNTRISETKHKDFFDEPGVVKERKVKKREEFHQITLEDGTIYENIVPESFRITAKETCFKQYRKGKKICLSTMSINNIQEQHKWKGKYD